MMPAVKRLSFFLTNWLSALCCASVLHVATALAETMPDCSDGKAQAIGAATFDVADRLAVINLINSYGYIADTFGPKRFDELFASDANILLTVGDKIVVDGLAQFKEFAGKRTEKYQREKTQRRHVLSAPRFDFQDAAAASGQAYLQYFETKLGAGPELRFVGNYSFRAVKREGVWKLSCWIARTDG